jgi:transcriptional regulator with XRE-family HTH domain
MPNDPAETGKRTITPELLTDVGKRLRWLREAYGHSQQQWADALLITPALLSKWEGGTRQPNLNSLVTICDQTQCTMDYFFRGRVGPDVPRDLREVLFAEHPRELTFVRIVNPPEPRSPGAKYVKVRRRQGQLSEKIASS